MKILNILLMSCISIVLMSCKKSDYPMPILNPIYLTSDAQTKMLRVDNVIILRSQYPDTDSDYMDYRKREFVVTGDWVVVSKGGSVPAETIKIDVKENTSIASRTYKVGLDYKGQIKILEIFQVGKKQ